MEPRMTYPVERMGRSGRLSSVLMSAGACRNTRHPRLRASATHDPPQEPEGDEIFQEHNETAEEQDNE
jgi:hypothetical protein